MILVDANVLVDVLAYDPARREWSEARLLEMSHAAGAHLPRPGQPPATGPRPRRRDPRRVGQ
jgi:hypothetical protein